jgi:hypothetical protein
MLGFAKDNIQTLLSAAEYLQKNNPSQLRKGYCDLTIN